MINVDKSGFSIRGISLGRSKSIVKVESRGNTTKATFFGTCDHISVILVTFETDKVYNSLIVLSIFEEKHLKRSDDRFETPQDIFSNQTIFL